MYAVSSIVGAGVVFPGPIPGSSEAEYAFGAAAFETMLEVTEALEGMAKETGVRRVGLISVALPGAQLDESRAQSESLLGMPGMKRVGDITPLGVGEPARRFPLLRPDFAGTWIAGFLRVDGQMFTEALLSVAAGLGTTQVHGSASLSRQGEHAEVRVDGDPVAAEAVIVTAGAWSAVLCRPLGLDLPVVPHGGQAVRLGNVSPPRGSMPTCGPATCPTSSRPRSPSRRDWPLGR
jgi:D-amino-acid dehydrogenase